MSDTVKEEEVKPATLDSLFADDDGAIPSNGSGGPALEFEVKPDLDDDDVKPNPLDTPSFTPPIDDDDIDAELKPGESSAGPSKKTPRKKKAEATPFKPTLIDDLPTAWDEAHATFDALERCVYERKDLGLSREQDEMMVCDCVYDREDRHADPCGAHSDCINRAIFIECLADECRAGRHCRNQRFARRQYADVEIVQTEKKGFGLRAASDLPAGSLVYEYIGEVVVEKTFRRRMAQYAEEGIKHFYFMMLQKEEYIDATKKGGIGRFANHSCNPNSEVQKWVVGRRLRMGIFTQRDVVKGEEITFNYNVDRYGHDAQICYCGEANCVGTIGGKTQTDLGGMNTLFLDALGITDEVEEMGYKGSKKKKARHLDDDYVPILHPIQHHEVPKVAAAIRQSMENNVMMTRLLERIKMTEEPAVQRQLMRMHGFSLMMMIVTEMPEERDIVLLALEGMSKWRVTIRNKIEDSNIEEPIQALRDGPDAELAAMAKDASLAPCADLLDYWATLELSYKIPRVSKIASLDDEDDRNTTTIAEANNNFTPYRRPTGLDELANNTTIALELAPIRARPHLPPPRRPLPPPLPKTAPATPVNTDKQKLAAIIALAQQGVSSFPPGSAASPASAAAESSGSGSRPAYDDDLERRSSSKRARSSSERAEEEERKARRLTKLVGEVVVRSMSKYKEQMDHETFKKYAKECTMTLVDKEKRGHSYASSRHPSLSEEKKAKMKTFTKEFAHKILKKLKERGKLRPSGSGVRRSSTSGGDGDSRLSATPALTAVSGSTSDLPTPHSSATLLDEMFGEDDAPGKMMDEERDRDIEIEMEIDTDSPSVAQTPTPSRTPGVNGNSHGGGDSTPSKPLVVDRVAGPFMSNGNHGNEKEQQQQQQQGSRNGPLLVDHFGSLS